MRWGGIGCYLIGDEKRDQPHGRLVASIGGHGREEHQQHGARDHPAAVAQPGDRRPVG